MASDALAAYRTDAAASKDVLLLCDAKEMADALSRRIHTDTIDPTAPTIGVGRAQRVAVRRPDHQPPQRPTIPVLDATRNAAAADAVRNGNRWRVYAIDPERNRIGARRIEDGARAAFAGDYLREHITYGYVVTVHSAQGVTADTAHALLGENTTRALLYVGMTRGRESNTVYLYQRLAGEADHQHEERKDVHMKRRGSNSEAAELLRSIIGAHDERARTAHEVGASTKRNHLPGSVASLVDRRAKKLNDGAGFTRPRRYGRTPRRQVSGAGVNSTSPEHQVWTTVFSVDPL